MNDPAFIPAWLDNMGLTPNEFRVFCRVVRRGSCYESIDSMSLGCGISESTTRRCLQALCKFGALSRVPQGGRPTIYRVATRTTGDTPYVSDTPVVRDTPLGSTRTTGDTPPVPLVTPKGSTIKDKRESPSKFKPPTLPEAVAYFQEKGRPADEGEDFWNFYESCGWKVGTKPMVKWHGAAGGWISRERKRQAEQATRYPATNGVIKASQYGTKSSWTQQH